MELVYLWVEDYKNIHKQGFNFSPRFSCEYDDVKNELTIKENDDYIENFFGENINVTAIVGKNGSGKSSIFEVLNLIKSNTLKNHFLLIYTIDSIKYYTSSFYLKTKLVQKNYFIDIRHYIYSNELLKIKNQISLEKSNILEKIIKNYLKNNNFKLSTFIYFPNYIHIKSINIDDYLNDYDTDDFGISLPNYILDILDSSLTFFVKKGYLDLIHIKKSNNDYHKFLICWYIGKYIYPSVPSDVELYNKMLKEDKLQEEEQTLISKDDYYKYFHNKNISKSIKSLTSNEIKHYIQEYKYLFDFDFSDEKDRRYNNLSHGEKVIFGQLLNIYSLSMNNSSAKLLFLFDEPEISLHPNWQKKYFKEVILLFQKIQKEYHFIFASHSPFLLSDIPKQNIIFLDKDEKGNCKVVDGLKEKKQTFGANIHTLLSDSFFMEDGLMGEFAKGKIDEVIKLLNKEKLDEKELKYCEQIISIIGEPIVKNQLQWMLDSKRLKKVDEIDAIKQSMEAMQKRLDELEK